MDDPSDPAVLGSVALGAALEAARANEVDVSGREQEVIERARADDMTRRPGRASAGAKIGGGPIPAEVSAQLRSLEIEYSRGNQPIDRLYGLDRLLGIFTHHGRVPVSQTLTRTRSSDPICLRQPSRCWETTPWIACE